MIQINPIEIEKPDSRRDAKDKDPIPRTSPRNLGRAAAGLLLVMGIAVQGVLIDRYHVFTPRLRTLDLVTPYTDRFKALKGRLPGRGVVGYWTDEQVTDVRSLMGFVLTQYALAPLVVVWGVDRPMIIGNFHEAPPSAELLAKRGLRVTCDLGNGVMILSPLSPP